MMGSSVNQGFIQGLGTAHQGTFQAETDYLVIGAGVWQNTGGGYGKLSAGGWLDTSPRCASPLHEWLRTDKG